MPLNEKPLTQDEIELLERFIKRADYVFEHSLLKERKLKVKTKKHWSAEEGYSEERHEIDIERLESLMLRLRMFMIANDAIQFNTVANLCSRYRPENVEASAIRDLKKLFENDLPKANIISFSKDGKTYRASEIVDLAFYGESFHINIAKMRTLSELREFFGNDIQDSLVAGIINMVNAVHLLRDVAKMVMDRHTERL